MTRSESSPDEQADRPYIVVSADAHASPSLERVLRNYCPERYLSDFDRFVAAFRHHRGDASLLRSAGQDADTDSAALRLIRIAADASSEDMAAVRTGAGQRQDPDDPVAQALEVSNRCRGYEEPTVHLRDMDADGVSANVVFPGGPNGEVLPFLAFGFDQGSSQAPLELRQAGSHIWNAWLADFVSVDQNRLVGVMQVAIADVEAAVTEIRWAHGKGLRALNLPAPRSDYAPYNDLVYEPLWSTCEELGIALVTHVGGGEFPLGTNGQMGMQIYMCESDWLARRGLWQLIFGGVFERHPSLKIVFVEQRVAWVPETLRHLDSIYYCDLFRDLDKTLPHPPSFYWHRNCHLGGSFLAPFEAEMRHDVGMANLMWGSDYPHMEGTWPHTRLAMRNTFQGIPEPDCRRILGTNAMAVFGLHAPTLREIADRIGPRPSELAAGVDQAELPPVRSNAFRRRGSFS